MFTEKQRKELIKIARLTLQSYIREKTVPQFKIKDDSFLQKQGVFVTLTKDSALRGCIGYIEGIKPLYEAVVDNTISAATRDYRFTPVTQEELPLIKIEISVLSPLKKVKSHNEIKMGEHGVLIKKGWRSGVYLPQVALETGWSKEEFLDNLCMEKAGIGPSYWREGDCDIYIFTVENFSE